jgi:hypothetical protein
MRIELLYFDDCPNYEALRLRAEQVLVDHGLAEHVELVRIASREEAEANRFLGSPTLRVDGHDIEPGADERSDFGMKCRIYTSAEDGLRPTPADELISTALLRAPPSRR